MRVLEDNQSSLKESRSQGESTIMQQQGTARGTSEVEEAEYFFKGAGCEAWEKSQ